MNFATLQGLTIPEGNVTQIADASGRVLWKASKTVTISYTLGDPVAPATYYNSIIHNGTEYTGSGSLIANIGDIILVRCAPGGQTGEAHIYLNTQGTGIAVASATGMWAEYNYEVVSDATVVKDTGSAAAYRGAIFITDANA